MKGKKILMMGLTPPLEGGSERHIYEISSRIKDADVLTQKGSICKNKIELPIFKESGFLKSISFFLSCLVYSIGLILFKKRYNIIHIHENLLYFLAPLLKLRYDVIITVHGITGFKFYENKLLWFFFGIALGFADKIISVSLPDKELLDKEFDNVVYVPNGVNFDEYKGIKAKSTKTIKFIGRIHEQKGIRHLLEAFEGISDDYPDYRLEILGDDKNDYAEALKREFQDENIIWKGFILNRKRLFNEIASAEILVFPSLWEALPWPALLEGLASGRPVIASDLMGMNKVFADGKNILLAEPGNSSEIARNIRLLLDNKANATLIGKNGKKAAENYSWDRIAKKIEEVYTK